MQLQGLVQKQLLLPAKFARAFASHADDGNSRFHILILQGHMGRAATFVVDCFEVGSMCE